MQFASPQAFYLLFLIPVLLAFFIWTSKRRNRFKAVLGDETLVEKLSLRVSPARDRWKPTLLLSGLFFLVIAMARPQWGRGTEEVVAHGVDIFLVLDTSFSMDAPDVAPSRMERARYIASELMERLQGNRIGLIVFSGTAFVQCPLTFDYGAARIFLDTVTTGIVPEPGTNIVAALEAAMRGFVAEGSRYKVVVLLTDGEQQSGDAVALAEKARDDDITIHTVGVGTPGGEPIPVRDERGNVTDYVRDPEGQPVLSRLDEETLGRVALLTGGKYFRISERDREIEEISTLVTGMEGEELESQLFRRFQERFYWPLALALVFLITETLVPREKRVSRTS
ncbi:MAG TPA: VWA domain-containing protein [Vicinamibacteria bacterium]|nr:VWA domain-containing protein [Vicinamibacteria bacterium]